MSDVYIVKYPGSELMATVGYMAEKGFHSLTGALISLFFADNDFSPLLRDRNFILQKFNKLMPFGLGDPGLTDVIQESGQASNFFPAIKDESKFNPVFQDQKMDQEYLDFFDKYETVVYISFGTMFMPSYELMMTILETIKMSDKTKVGFIVSLRDYAESYEDMKNANVENMLLKSF